MQPQRVKFADFRFERTAGGQCRAEIVLQSPDGREHQATGEAVGDAPTELRCIAQATVTALEAAIDRPGTFEILGVKAVRAFDQVVIIVALSARRGDQAQRLVGSYLAESDAEKGAALAVLNATNRYLGNTIFAR